MTDEKKPDDGPEMQAAAPAEGPRPGSGPADEADIIAGAEPVAVDPDAAPHDPQDPGFPPRDPAEEIAGAETVVETPEASHDEGHGYPTRDAAEDAYDADAPKGDPDDIGEAELAAGLETGSDLEASETAEPDERRDPEPAPAPYYDDLPVDDEPEHEEQPRSSLAARALQGLVILLVGAAIALWALPRVLPMLPAPVAGALAPASAVTPEDLAALKAGFETRIAALEAATPAAPDLGPVTARLDTLGARIDTLEGAAPVAAGGESSDLVEANKAAIASLRAELETMSATLAQLGNLPPEAAASLASASQRAASLSEKVDALTSRLDAAEARFDERATAAETAAQAALADAEAAEKRAALAAGFRAIGQALDEGLAFEPALTSISTYAEPPKALASAAAGGVPTLSALRERFTDAGRRAMEAQGLAEAGDSFLDRAAASLKARVAGVPVEAMEGDGLEARLGRAAAALRDGDLAAALEALEGIPHPAEEAMSDWLVDARARQAAVAAAAAWRVELGG